MGDNRAQIMLGLQHNPDNPVAKMHDHALDIHIAATLKNREDIDAAKADYQKHAIGTEEQALADAFFKAREEFSRTASARRAKRLKAGEFLKAHQLLLSRINPLYQEVMTKGEALQQYLYRTGEQDFQTAQRRYGVDPGPDRRRHPDWPAAGGDRRHLVDPRHHPADAPGHRPLQSHFPEHPYRRDRHQRSRRGR